MNEFESLFWSLIGMALVFFVYGVANVDDRFVFLGLIFCILSFLVIILSEED